MNAIDIKACKSHDITFRKGISCLSSVERNKEKKVEQEYIKNSRREGYVERGEKPQAKGADPLSNVNDINEILFDLFNREQYSTAALLIFGINTGYRCGDALSFRVKDLVDEDGKCVSELYIVEQKTGKTRTVYINQTVKNAIEFIIKKNKLTPENWIFKAKGNRTKGNRTAYFVKWLYNKDGEIVGMKTCGEKYNDDGSEREIAPMRLKTFSEHIKKEAAKYSIAGRYSSHSMRQTFSYHMGKNWGYDMIDPMISSVALAHSDLKTTIDHYVKIDPNKLKVTWNNLNLGLEVLELFINDKEK